MNDRRFLTHRINNLIHSALLLGGMALLMSFLGWLTAGKDGVVWAIIIGAVILFISPRFSPTTVLKLYGARPLARSEVPALHALVERLSERAALPHGPGLYYVRSRILNAFSVGNKKRSAIALTDGLLRTLSLRELTGVLAHEISHIRHNDMWVMGLADIVSRITSFFSILGQILLLISLPFFLMGRFTVAWLPILILIFAPTLSALMQLALSRSREFDADLEGAELSGDPVGLASALEKMERYQGGLLERIFMPGRREPHPSLLRSHPRTEERIRRLLSLVEPPESRARDHDDGFIPLGFTEVSRKPRYRIGGFWY